MSEKIYVNTASCGLLSKESIAAATAFLETMQTNASKAAETIRDEVIERIRSKVASFLDAPVQQLAFLPNFSWGLNAIVQSLKGNEKVLLYNNDYPSLTAPFKINGFDITWIEDKDGFGIESEQLKQMLIENKINLLVISHVQWLSGFKLDIDDIGAFCKEHDILFVLDATQSLGAATIHISKQHIDVLICSNYKWMNAGFGTGILYVSESFMNKYPPVVGGGNSYVTEHEVSNYVASVKNFEPGHINLHGLLVLEKAVDYKLERGIASIAAHNHQLLQALISGLDKSLILGAPDLHYRSSILVLKDPGNLFEYLTNHGVVTIKRGNNIRIGVHFYNTAEEIQQLIKLIAAGIA